MEDFGPNSHQVHRFLTNSRLLPDSEHEAIRLTYQAFKAQPDLHAQLFDAWGRIWKEAYKHGLNHRVTAADRAANDILDGGMSSMVAAGLVMRYLVEPADFALVFAPMEIRGYDIDELTKPQAGESRR